MIGETRMKPKTRLVEFGRLLITETDDCLEWPGAKTAGGYGRLNAGKTSTLVHVAALEIRTGERPPGMDAMHSCHNRACMNYRHLSWGTRSQNIRMMMDAGRHPSQSQTHCSKGHELTGDNVRTETGGRRRCRQCKSDYDRAYRAART
jgi:hypothetical protein